jgi:hypothetical protein
VDGKKGIERRHGTEEERRILNSLEEGVVKALVLDR